MPKLRYNVCAISMFEPAFMGSYPLLDSDPELSKDIRAILSALQESPGSIHDVPLCPNFAVTGHRIGKSYSLTILRRTGDVGKSLAEYVEVATYFFALDDHDVAEVCQQSMDLFDGFEDADEAHPEFRINMLNHPVAPFITIVASNALFKGKIHKLSTPEEIEMATNGFIPVAFGLALGEADFKATVSGDHGSRPSQPAYNAKVVATAVQTGGREEGVLIVERGDDGYPEIFAFLADAELDVVRVDFDHGAVRLDTDRLSHVALDDEFLDKLNHLRQSASEVHCDLEGIYDEVEMFGLAAFDRDPFEDFYSDAPIIEIPIDIADQVRARLGLSVCYPRKIDLVAA